MHFQFDANPTAYTPFDVEIIDGVLVARCVNESLHDQELLAVAFQGLEREVAERSLPLLLNLERVGLVTTESIASILSLRNRLDEHKHTVALCSLESRVRQSLNVVRLDLLFEIHDDEASAIASLGVR